MSFTIGESVGHYEIVEELGSGASGRVLKVQHLITRRREAMKILVDNKPDSPEQAQRFLREIRLQASLDHPNIAAVHNAFWLEDDLIMIMELIDGHPLAALLENRRFSMEQSLTIIRQVLQALAFAHKNGVIHRDVSPANIIVSANGKVKLTDFGLAKGSTDPSITEMGGMYGSPFYVSPEQVRGAATVDHRTDIYSTAVVLYELLTGTRPFIAASSFLLMQAHVQQVPEPPIFRNSAIPQYLNAAILKAMSKNPDDRFQTSMDFLAAIDGPQAAPVVVAKVEAPKAAAPPPPLSPTPVPAALIEKPQVEFSHSFAEPLPFEPIEFESRYDKGDKKPTVKPIPVPAPSAPPRFAKSPVVAASLGVGIVLCVMVPMIVMNWRSEDSRTPPKPAPLTLPTAASETTAPLLSAPPPALTPGPKEVLPPAPKAAPRNYGTRTAPKPTAAAAPPPTIKVWGAASASSPAPVATVATPPPAAPASAAKTSAAKIEEPPALAPAKTEAAIKPTIQPLPPTAPPERRGFFRRLARGVKNLNPVKRDEPDASSAAKP
jgi:serine/threonine-protein kinase